MTREESEFLQKLRSMFKVEAEEHLHAMSGRLLELEKYPPRERQVEAVEAAFRHAHSLKGAARAVNLAAIEAVCQALESFFSEWKRREVRPTPEHFDALHRAIDLIGSSLPSADGMPADVDGKLFKAITRQLDELGEKAVTARPPAGEDVPSGSDVPSGEDVSSGSDVPSGHFAPSGAGAPSSDYAPSGADAPSSDYASSGADAPSRDYASSGADAPSPEGGSSGDHAPARSDETVGNETAASESGAVAARSPADEASSGKSAVASTVRISTEKLDQLLVAAEELLAVKLATARRAADLRDLKTGFDYWKAEWAQDGPSAGHITLLNDKLQAICKTLSQDEIAVGRRVDDLLSDAKQLLMLPFHTVLDLFPKLARDLSRAQGKEVELVTRGGEVEMDKRILEEMKDVLIHLVRNGIDHGIEKPEERARHGKPLLATIEIAVAQVDDNRVEILVTDDGAGIDLERVKKVAVKRGMLAGAEASELSDQKALALIFQSDVSTSPIITEISGRGLGLAIVREKTEKLGGRVVVESRPRAGTTFRINIPSVLATFRGILVQTSGRHFIIPTAHVERAARYKAADVKTVENRETISLDGRAISLARLDGVLELPRMTVNGGNAEYFYMVVLTAGDERIAFVVDEILREEEVLVKSLGRPLTRVRNIAGATVLGSGKVVPVLNVLDLMKSAWRPNLMPVAAARGAAPEEAPAKRMRILIAEDSITSRMLLKNIVESAGHEVETAVDGVEALTELRTGDFDLVVSDIEMPRMNGFDLTTHIRNDGRLAATPVILVTALSSREDRERGIDVGASAYIVKSSFDQSNLLEAIRRLTS